MVEDSVESFVIQFRPYAAEVEILPRIEGSPLIECFVAGKILHVLERTGPYDARPGRTKLILSVVSEKIIPLTETKKAFSAPSIGRIKAQGVVLAREEESLIVDAGLPLVVSSFNELPTDTAQGDWVSFDSLAPLHGFVVKPEKRVYRRESGEGDAI